MKWSSLDTEAFVENKIVRLPSVPILCQPVLCLLGPCQPGRVVVYRIFGILTTVP